MSNKIIASVSKKVPVPGVAYSNQQFHGGLEMEVPEGVSDAELRERFRQLYELLTETVDAEIAAVVAAGPVDGGNPVGYSGRDQMQGRRRGEERRVLSIPSARGAGGEREGQSPGDWGRDSRASQPYSERDREDRRDGGWDRRPREEDRGRGRSGSTGGTGGGGRGGPATQAQIKAVFGIAKGQGVERRDLMRRINDQFGVRRVEDLNVREASTLIEALKAS